MTGKILKICFISLFIMIGCNVKEKEYAHKELLDIIKKQDPEEIFNDYGDIWIFLKSKEENKYGYSPLYALQSLYVYTDQYKHLPYPEFITLAVTNQLDFDCNEMFRKYCFIPNDTIVDFYDKNSLDVFLNRYTTESGVAVYYVKNTLDFNSILTVMYCLYQNEYYSMDNCYIGGYFIKPLEGWKPIHEDVEMIDVEE